MSNPKPHQKLIFASVPLVLTFVNGPAAMSYECQNRDASACSCKAALSFEKQQKTTRRMAGAAFSASTVVETAMPAARSAGKRYTPVEIAGKAIEVRLKSRQSAMARA